MCSLYAYRGMRESLHSTYQYNTPERRGKVDVVRNQNAYIIGDAAGLATRDLCEGIGPAVESGLRAAESIMGGRDYTVENVTRYSGSGLASKLPEQLFIGRAA